MPLASSLAASFAAGERNMRNSVLAGFPETPRCKRSASTPRLSFNGSPQALNPQWTPQPPSVAPRRRASAVTYRERTSEDAFCWTGGASSSSPATPSSTARRAARRASMIEEKEEAFRLIQAAHHDAQARRDMMKVSRRALCERRRHVGELEQRAQQLAEECSEMTEDAHQDEHELLAAEAEEAITMRALTQSKRSAEISRMAVEDALGSLIRQEETLHGAVGQLAADAQQVMSNAENNAWTSDIASFAAAKHAKHEQRYLRIQNARILAALELGEDALQAAQVKTAVTQEVMTDDSLAAFSNASRPNMCFSVTDVAEPDLSPRAKVIALEMDLAQYEISSENRDALRAEAAERLRCEADGYRLETWAMEDQLAEEHAVEESLAARLRCGGPKVVPLPISSSSGLTDCQREGLCMPSVISHSACGQVEEEVSRWQQELQRAQLRTKQLVQKKLAIEEASRQREALMQQEEDISKRAHSELLQAQEQEASAWEAACVADRVAQTMSDEASATEAWLATIESEAAEHLCQERQQAELELELRCELQSADDERNAQSRKLRDAEELVGAQTALLERLAAQVRDLEALSEVSFD